MSNALYKAAFEFAIAFMFKQFEICLAPATEMIKKPLTKVRGFLFALYFSLRDEIGTQFGTLFSFLV